MKFVPVEVDRLPAPQELVPALANDPQAAFLLDADLRLTYVNPAWDDFAMANDGAEVAGGAWLRRSIFDCVPAVLRPLYERAYAIAAAKHVELRYECHAPELRREFLMRISPVAGGGRVVQNLLVDARPVSAPDETLIHYEQGGIITMCANCRAVKLLHSLEWRFVPQCLDRTLQMRVSHGLCPLCTAYLYPEFAAKSRAAAAL